MLYIFKDFVIIIIEFNLGVTSDNIQLNFTLFTMQGNDIKCIPFL